MADGRSCPFLPEVPALAKVLKAAPVQMIAGWVIDQFPNLVRDYLPDTITIYAK
jgi:hypothetical protein